MNRLEIIPDSIKGNHAGFGSEGPAKGVGAHEDQKYCQPWSGDAFLACSLATPETASLYTLSSSGDAQGRDPKEWILYGSADGETWKPLDHQREATFNNRRELKAFEIGTPEPFRHYKLQILAQHGDAAMQFSRFALFAAK